MSKPLVHLYETEILFSAPSTIVDDEFSHYISIMKYDLEFNETTLVANHAIEFESTFQYFDRAPVTFFSTSTKLDLIDFIGDRRTFHHLKDYLDFAFNKHISLLQEALRTTKYYDSIDLDINPNRFISTINEAILKL